MLVVYFDHQTAASSLVEFDFFGVFASFSSIKEWKMENMNDVNFMDNLFTFP